MIDDVRLIKARKVQVRTLDSFELDNVSFIKIDVEGHEEAVIEGARGLLLRNRPVLLVESEDRHNPGAPNRLIAQLKAMNFDAYFLRRGKLHVVADLTSEESTFSEKKYANHGYVNNYIFVPAELDHKKDALRKAIEQLPRNLVRVLNSGSA